MYKLKFKLYKSNLQSKYNALPYKSTPLPYALIRPFL
jgi:hypothetical protein